MRRGLVETAPKARVLLVGICAVCYRRLAYKRRAKKREEFIPLGVLAKNTGRSAARQTKYFFIASLIVMSWR